MNENNNNENIELEDELEKTRPLQEIPEYLKLSGMGESKKYKKNRNSNMNNKGFAQIFLVLPITGIILTGGYWGYTRFFNVDNTVKVVQTNPRDEAVQQIQIITDYINIRAEKDTKSDIVGQVYKDEIYTVISEEETTLYHWYEIKTANGISGYLAGTDEYITLLGDSKSNTQSNERDESKRQLIITTDYINIRESKDTKSNIMGKVYKDEIYTIISEDSNSTYHWYEIETNKGVKGFISGKNDYVSVFGEENNRKITNTISSTNSIIINNNNNNNNNNNSSEIKQEENNLKDDKKEDEKLSNENNEVDNNDKKEDEDKKENDNSINDNEPSNEENNTENEENSSNDEENYSSDEVNNEDNDSNEESNSSSDEE